METFYFFANVANCASRTVRISDVHFNRASALSGAVQTLELIGYDTVSIQNASKEQFDSAAQTAPMFNEVAASIKVAPVRLNPVNPV